MILGLASFVCHLNSNGIVMYLSGDYLVCNVGVKQQRFLYKIMPEMAVDCGFIETDEKTLKAMFPINEISLLKKSCEKNKSDKFTHCPNERTNKRGKISATVDGVDFNCRLDPRTE